MKKLITMVLVLAAVGVRAQEFEGTIKWTMKMEITDPKKKAEMEEMQKKINDPANQAKMKEMEEAMKDPQMKAMMDANPQMKAQMEARMKMMQGGGANGMMPQGFTLKLKGGNRITTMEGGMMAGEMLYLKDKDQTVRLDRQNKTYSVMPTGGMGNPNASNVAPKVTKTSETMKIMNYNCVKYIVELNENGRAMTQNIWTTKDITDVDMKTFKQRMGQGTIYFEGMEGVPLKIEASTGDGNMIMEVSEIKRGSLNAADFTIPAGFKEVPMMGRP